MRMAFGFLLVLVIGCTAQAAPPQSAPPQPVPSDALDRCINEIVRELTESRHHNPFFPHPVKEACEPYLEPTPVVPPGALR